MWKEREEAVVAAAATVRFDPEQKSLDGFPAGAGHVGTAAVGTLSE